MLPGLENLRIATRHFKSKGIPADDAKRLAWNSLQYERRVPGMKMLPPTVRQHMVSIYLHDQTNPPNGEQTYQEKHHVIIALTRKGS